MPVVSQLSASVPTFLAILTGVAYSIANFGTQPVYITIGDTGPSTEGQFLASSLQIAPGDVITLTGRTGNVFAWSGSSGSLLSGPVRTSFSGLARMAYLGSSVQAGSGNQAGGASTNANQDFDPVNHRAYRVQLGGGMAFHTARCLSFRAVTVATPCTGGAYISSENNAAANPLLEWQLIRALANDPTHMSISIGTNEAGNAGVALTTTQLNTFTGQMRKVVKIAQAFGVIVIIQTIPPRVASSIESDNVDKINERWMRLCRERDCTLWDIYKYVATAARGWLANLSTDNIHINGTALTTMMDQAIGDVITLFPGVLGTNPRSVTRSTAAAPTDDLLQGALNGIVNSAANTAVTTAIPGYPFTRSAGADANVTFTRVTGEGDEAAGQRWMGEMLKMATTNQALYRQTVQDYSTQLTPGDRITVAAWVANPVVGSDAARISLRFTFFDGPSVQSYRSTLIDGNPSAFAAEALIMIEVAVPALAPDLVTPITQLHWDMGHAGAVASTCELNVADFGATRIPA